MKSSMAKILVVTALSAAYMLILTSCNGLLVNSQTEELTWLGRATLRAGNVTHAVGATDTVILDGAYPVGTDTEAHNGQ